MLTSPDDMAKQRYWLLTVGANAQCFEDWPPQQLPAGVLWIRGQRELGAGGFDHWQVIVGFKDPSRLAHIQAIWPGAHAEFTRSDAADEYVWKEDTRVPGTQFELGVKPLRRNKSTDWDRVWTSATAGDFLAIPSDIRVRHFSSLCRIRTSAIRPVALVRTISVWWGPTGTGKTRSAWNGAGLDAYAKCPSNKWWDGYDHHQHVVLDEFAGVIPITDLLRWFDRYPCHVETKGGSVALAATHYYVTSNIDPLLWYSPQQATNAQIDALMRRLTTVHHVIEPIVFD